MGEGVRLISMKRDRGVMSRQPDATQPSSLEYVTIGSRRLLLDAKCSLVGWNDFSVTGTAK